MADGMTYGPHRGEVALVTGANKGIGREVARRLAAEGMTVHLGARDLQRGRTAELELSGGGADVRFVQLDVTDEGQIGAAVKRIDQDFGKLDVLINNAGVLVEVGTAPEDVTMEQMRRSFDVNVLGPVAVTRACVPLLRRSPAGRVVNLSTKLASLSLLSDERNFISTVGLLAYSTSKAALNAATILYANALRKSGIRVNVVSPGVVATDMSAKMPIVPGTRTVEQGAEAVVALALEGANGSTGTFRDTNDHDSIETVPW